MQSTYTMAMMRFKLKQKDTTVAGPAEGTLKVDAQKMFKQLEYGLDMVFDAIQNYTIAYEAIEGMKG